MNPQIKYTIITTIIDKSMNFLRFIFSFKINLLNTATNIYSETANTDPDDSGILEYTKIVQNEAEKYNCIKFVVLPTFTVLIRSTQRRIEALNI